MAAELQKLKENSKAVVPYQTPPPSIAGPSPKKGSSPKREPTPAAAGEPSSSMSKACPDSQKPLPATEGAKLNRLRRLCEIKPSGKCQVPQEIHERWKSSTKEEKEAMIEELERAHWSKELLTNGWYIHIMATHDNISYIHACLLVGVYLICSSCWLKLFMQDLFVSRITKVISQNKKLSRKKRRGWYTKEQMAKTLGWSSSLVMKFCDQCITSSSGLFTDWHFQNHHGSKVIHKMRS